MMKNVVIPKSWFTPHNWKPSYVYPVHFFIIELVKRVILCLSPFGWRQSKVNIIHSYQKSAIFDTIFYFRGFFSNHYTILPRIHIRTPFSRQIQNKFLQCHMSRSRAITKFRFWYVTSLKVLSPRSRSLFMTNGQGHMSWSRAISKLGFWCLISMNNVNI